MNTITREELKQELEINPNIKLVFTKGDWYYRAMHIPGTIHFSSIKEALQLLHKDDDIVLYCSNTHCRDSVYAYHLLVNNGYTRVRRYSGGLEDWVDAGYPVHGWLSATSSHTDLAVAS